MGAEEKNGYIDGNLLPWEGMVVLEVDGESVVVAFGELLWKSLSYKGISSLYESVIIRDQSFSQYCFNYICKWQNNFANNARQYG